MLGGATVGTLVGGIGPVTLLRLVQAGKKAIEEERAETADARASSALGSER